MRRFASTVAASLAVLGTASVAHTPADAQTAPGYHVAGQIALPDGRWDYASFDPARRRVYIAHGSVISTIDVDTKAVTPALAKGAGLHAAFALPGGDVIASTNGATDSLQFSNATTGDVLASVKVGKKPDAAIYDAATNLVLVMNGDSGDVSLVDPDKRAVVGSIAIGGALEFAATDGAGLAFVNIEDQGKIAVLDLKAKTVVARYDLKNCVEPSGLAYAPDAGVLVAACANGMAKVVNAASGAEVATLAVGIKPDAVIWDGSRKLAFIPSGGAGTLSVIAVRGPTDVSVVQTVTTQTGARTGAVDPKTGALYLPTASYQPPAQPGQRPTIVPGSFKVLVVAPN